MIARFLQSVFRNQLAEKNSDQCLPLATIKELFRILIISFLQGGEKTGGRWKIFTSAEASYIHTKQLCRMYICMYVW
jgi:hypothetical protein